MAGETTQRQYGDGTDSDIGTQFNTSYWLRKALVEKQKERFFTPYSNSVDMPKHYGKKLTKYHYMPLLDDRNINDQGIDASGVVIADGNLYGSSKDIGLITSKLPLVGETGGRVNRVGFKRLDLEGTFQKFGMFHEFTDESLKFDTDAELQTHISREFVYGAVEVYEDVLQRDLLMNATTVRYPGAATSDATISGEDGAVTEVDYDTLMRLSIDLDDVRTPKHTKMLTGTRLIDTKTVAGARALHIGSEMVPTLKYMTDPFNNPAFIPVHKYAANADVLNGEIGAVDQFRIVQVPEMLNFGAVGASVTNNAGYRESGGKYIVYPMLCIGAESFVTIGFETDGKSSKFRTIFKPPGKETADRTDPYGETGFGSIKWWYGTMFLRKERLGLIKSVARQ